MPFIQRLRRLLPREPLIPRDPVVYRPIGVVRNRVRAMGFSDWSDLGSDIVLHEDLASALDFLDGFSHVIVVFHLDRVPESERRVLLPVGHDASQPERGVLATRSPLRPNAIGVSVARVLHRNKNVLRVKGLDAIDGTPVLDLKPYLPPYDSVPDATLPDWALRR